MSSRSGGARSRKSASAESATSRATRRAPRAATAAIPQPDRAQYTVAINKKFETSGYLPKTPQEAGRAHIYWNRQRDAFVMIEARGASIQQRSERGSAEYKRGAKLRALGAQGAALTTKNELDSERLMPSNTRQGVFGGEQSRERYLANIDAIKALDVQIARVFNAPTATPPARTGTRGGTKSKAEGEAATRAPRSSTGTRSRAPAKAESATPKPARTRTTRAKKSA